MLVLVLSLMTTGEEVGVPLGCCRTGEGDALAVGVVDGGLEGLGRAVRVVDGSGLLEGEPLAVLVFDGSGLLEGEPFAVLEADGSPDLVRDTDTAERGLVEAL